MKDLAEFKEVIEKLFRVSVIEEGGFLCVNKYDRTFKIEISYIEETIHNLNQKIIKEETILYSSNSFEVLTRLEGSRFWRFDNKIVKEDTVNGIEYEFGFASNEYLLFILQKINEAGMLRELRRWSGSFHRMFDRDRFPEVTLLDFISRSIPTIHTIKIRSQNVKNPTEFEHLSNAFMFHLSFNLDVAIIELRYLDEFFRTERMYRVRRTDLEEVEPPKRKYISDLVYHYQRAVSTDSPYLQFISFYHVI